MNSTTTTARNKRDLRLTRSMGLGATASQANFPITHNRTTANRS